MNNFEKQVAEFEKNFYADLKNLRINIFEEILRNEIFQNFYGVEIKEIFFALSPIEQNLILRALRLQELSKGRRLYFRLAVQSLFPHAKVYFNSGKWLMFLPEKKSDSALKKIELIKILFMDFSNAEIDLYFEKSFGVFDTPRTMRLDEMILY